MFRQRFVLILVVIAFAIYLVRNDEHAVPSKKATAFESTTVNHFELTKVAKDKIFLDLKTALNQSSIHSVSDILREAQGFNFKEPAGQVGPDSAYGQVLSELAARDEIQVVLETGTWDGTGSSLAIGQGLLNSGGVLFTIEAVEEKWIHAQHNLAIYPVRCLLGVGVDTANYPKIEDVETVNGMEQMHKDWRSWHAAEKRLADLYPVGLIKPICERYPVQFVHIDGAEFAGVDEYTVVRKYCDDVKFIAMDDVRTFKNFINYKKLKNDPTWKVYKENLNERNGWAVFVRAD